MEGRGKGGMEGETEGGKEGEEKGEEGQSKVEGRRKDKYGRKERMWRK